VNATFYCGGIQRLGMGRRAAPTTRAAPLGEILTSLNANIHKNKNKKHNKGEGMITAHENFYTQ